MKKRWLIALVICMYAIQAAFVCMLFIPENSYGSVATDICVNLLWIFIALSLVFIVINILYSFKMFRKKILPADGQNPFKLVMRIKLILIPYYVANFILWILVASISVIPFFLFIGWILWIAIFLATIFTYVTLLATSSYAIAQIILLKQREIIGFFECIIHIVLQFIFVADVADAIYLYTKFEKHQTEIQPPPVL